MGNTREVVLPAMKTGESEVIEMTNLEYSLQFVKYKIQEMIYNGRKTEQCGVILFGTEGTHNVINEKNSGYDHVMEYIPIAQPNAGTLARLDALRASTVSGDPVDALIVGIETQHQYLVTRKTWTRKIVLITDGENPIEIEDWEATVKKMNDLEVSLTIVGVDFDDDEMPFHEEGKSEIKLANEEFYHKMIEELHNGVLGNCEYALREVARPDVKQTKSALMGTVLRIGDCDTRSDEAIEVLVKTSKCTAIARPKAWKKFARRERTAGDEGQSTELEGKTTFAQLRMRTEYFIDRGEMGTEDGSVDGDKADEDMDKKENLEKVEKEQLVRGFKYGATYAPCPDGQFPRLQTRKGIEICGFFKEENFRRELPMSEVSYIWADQKQPKQQVALSAIVQAMYEKECMAIARMVRSDGTDPKMGVLSPVMFENVDCLLWVQMPFADDVRDYPFPSLDTLISKKGEVVTKHPYLPTDKQLEAMERFVDAMDLMDAGEKDENGKRQSWFDTTLSYNPAIHRTKQAQFHAAIVSDLSTHPLPPPHPELTKYFEPPKRVLKRARDAIEECKDIFQVNEVPRKITRTRKDGHVRAKEEDEDMLLLDKMAARRSQSQAASQVASLSQRNSQSQHLAQTPKKQALSDSETESESEEEAEDLLLEKKRHETLPTPSPESDFEPDSGMAPNRIIGTTHPLQDFKKNIARGDVVTKAVEDLGAVIKEIVLKPFASRRTGELLSCMRELRRVALEEDEIDAWNAFLKDLQQSCRDDKPGNEEFWTSVQGLGRDISLISNTEAGKLGGKSDISESEAAEFIQQ
ncbi:SPOC domain-like protein [Laetiporus sulphureus 93-53]|uniref:ATP-dependent DNA helicase II subunit 2 n=1 Tax=Laetiporus sulphureus 93-53 TaxID=1314785 RepID=A0A165FGM6_9APHY|nr:SPOC domain-like protein [Laetiporus sulphureus 93-53]KZT08940.1 SPOC domain-like protein [Laetiporus sulphureus 93-53]